jgi:hypothetical protein
MYDYHLIQQHLLFLVADETAARRFPSFSDGLRPLSGILYVFDSLFSPIE